MMAYLHRRMVRLHTHSLMYHVFARGRVPVAFPAVFILLSVLLPWQVLPNCRGFPLTSLSLASSQLLMQTPRVRLATGLLILLLSTLTVWRYAAK